MLHESAMKAYQKRSKIEYLLEQGSSVAGELDLDALFVDVEQFLYGFLDGWSFDEINVCSTGLYSAIGSFFDCLEYREIWIPSNTIALPIAINEFEEAMNTIFAYCDFTHVYDVIASLIDFQSGTEWMKLLARLSGAAIIEIPQIINTIDTAWSDGDYYNVGYGSGQTVQVVLDSNL